MNDLEIDYEELIKEIKEQNPKNYTELIWSILAVTGSGCKSKYWNCVFNTLNVIEIIKPLDEQLFKIACIKGELIGRKSMHDYNKTHNIKVILKKDLAQSGPWPQEVPKL